MSVSSRFPPEVTAWMERWRLLRDGELLTTHSSWILPVRQGDMPAMLKVARIPDEEAGYRLLTWWDGQGAARVFASAAGALLMERASGAGDLAQIAWSGQDDEACRIDPLRHRRSSARAAVRTAARSPSATGMVPAAFPVGR